MSSCGLAYVHLGQILLAQSDLPGAEQALCHTQHLSATHTVYPDLQSLTRIFEIQLRLAQGQREAALQVAESCANESWY